MKKITVHFLGYPDVGIFPYSYKAEVPQPEDDEDREEIRKLTTEYYETLTIERATWALFEDEEFNDEGKLIKKEK